MSINIKNAATVYNTLRTLWSSKNPEAKIVARALEAALSGQLSNGEIIDFLNRFSDQLVATAIADVIASRNGMAVLAQARLSFEKIEKTTRSSYRTPVRPSVRKARTQAQNRSRQVQLAENRRPRFVHLWMNPRSPVAA